MAKDLTQKEVTDIVKDEIKSFARNELTKEIEKILTSGKGNDVMKDEIKAALSSLYKFMWTKRDVWKSNIR